MKLVKESKRGGKVSEHSLCKKPCALSLAWPVYHSSPRLRVMTFAVSVRGALGSEAQTFIRQLSARVAGAVPYRLLDEASWATQGCAPLLRSAITFSARRALAAGIRRSTCSGAEAAYVERCDDQPAPDPACCFDCPVDPAPAEQ